METPDTQEKQEEKGSRPPPTHTHQRDSYILQNLRNKLFSMCFFKICLLGVLKALLTYCYHKVQRGREALG